MGCRTYRLDPTSWNDTIANDVVGAGGQAAAFGIVKFAVGTLGAEVLSDEAIGIDNVFRPADLAVAGIEIGGDEDDFAVEFGSEGRGGGNIACRGRCVAGLGAENTSGCDRDPSAFIVGGVGRDVAIFEGNEGTRVNGNVATGERTRSIGCEETATQQGQVLGAELNVAAPPAGNGLRSHRHQRVEPIRLARGWCPP